MEGYSHKEIAIKMNISTGTSKSQFNRARKMLISMLNKHSA
ncbi:MAG: sigma factor-like helix-turn-helix DNA-binding protein [Bacteroidales bacterium]|nr:sigma factor-like helix-turn-helix DNA-binding protein [Bacteroidales bacterium]